jgi:hypothetical protein
MRTHKGIYYFEDYATARAYAQARGWNDQRIIAYDLGWAVQRCISGDYYGPKDEATQ